jgi:hypothetical protein
MIDNPIACGTSLGYSISTSWSKLDQLSQRMLPRMGFVGSQRSLSHAWQELYFAEPFPPRGRGGIDLHNLRPRDIGTLRRLRSRIHHHELNAPLGQMVFQIQGAQSPNPGDKVQSVYSFDARHLQIDGNLTRDRSLGISGLLKVARPRGTTVAAAQFAAYAQARTGR